MKTHKVILFINLLMLCFTANASVQQAYLIQNSGWMEPFYTDSQSLLKPLVSAVANATSHPNDTVFLLAFNQSNGANVSPQLVYEGTGVASFDKALNSISLARKGNNSALADTDFKEAVIQTITGPMQAKPGIIWIFTNNKNSPNNDLQTAARNQDFYNLLHLEPSIVKTIVFPLKMIVKGNAYDAKGLMVYGLAYGEEAAKELDAILAEGRLTKVLTQPYAKLKPIDQDALRIVPERIANSSNIKVMQGSDNRTVILDVDASKFATEIILHGTMQNQFYPYVIKEGRVTATLTANGVTVPVLVDTVSINGLEPGERQNIKVKLNLPFAQIPSAWSSEAFGAMGKQYVIPMTVEIGLADQKLSLSEKFTDGLKDLFPGDPISEVFTPPESVKASIAKVPLLVRIQYPLMPVVFAILGLLVLVGLMAWLAFMLTQSKYFKLEVIDYQTNGLERISIAVRTFSSAIVTNSKGQDVGKVRNLFGQLKVVKHNSGFHLKEVK